ncbi:hypothetical protein [Botrimarina hoheduenensis]|nr:hypothetical protein [Botrimarina hoheduenensis]
MFRAAVGFALLGFGLAPNLASADLIVNDFDSAGEAWRFDFGSPILPSISVVPTEGSPGNPMGAMRLDMTFVSSQGGNNRFAFTNDAFPAVTDLTGYASLDFDLKIAPGAALDAFGNHGFFQFVSREGDGYGFNSVLGTNLAPNTGVWQSYSIPTSSMSATRAFTIQLYGGPSQNIDGPITLFLDNVRLVEIPEPASIALAAAIAAAGLGFRRR